MRRAWWTRAPQPGRQPSSRRGSAASSSRAASCSTSTSTASSAWTAASTRSSPSTSTGPAPRPTRADDGTRARWRASARCTGCRSRSRTPSRPRASARPAARVELTDHVPAADAPAVARLKAAGAIVFGKTNLPRWSGDLQTYNEIFGTTNNPWDARSHRPGGSSGGAAAAVAGGFTSFEIGTDIGGSVRIPSHCCGVFGLKPSFGVIPQRGYLDHVGGGTTDADINVFGPIARSADDLDLLLGVLAGPEPERAVGVATRAARRDARSLADLRVGVWFDDAACADRLGVRARCCAPRPIASPTPARRSRTTAPAGRLRRADATCSCRMIVPAMAPSLPDETEPTASVRLAPRVAPGRGGPRRAAAALGRVVRATTTCSCARSLTTPAFPHDHDRRHVEPHDRDRRAARCHVEHHRLARAHRHRRACPRRSCRSAAPPAGLPVGMQIVAPYLHDRRAVRAAELITAVLGGYEVPPGF